MGDLREATNGNNGSVANALLRSTTAPPVTASDAAETNTILFDRTWNGSVLGIAMSVELRIASQGTAFQFQLVVDIGGQRVGRTFIVAGPVATRIPLPLVGDLVIGVSDWSVTATQLTFDWTLAVTAPFVPTITLASERVIVALAPQADLARLTALAPTSAAELLAALTLFNGGQTSRNAATLASNATPAKLRPLVTPLTPDTYVASMTWLITTGGDDRRADSTVFGRVVMKDGTSESVELDPGRAWGNGSSASCYFPLTTSVRAGDVDHLQLEFTSHAGTFESTDNWDVAALVVSAVCVGAGGSDFSATLYEQALQLRLKGQGVFPFAYNLGT